ncbi:sperm acrosome membrane-associated protein 4-like [Pempheris klunzingeri]|uniref:sperm acrosome membrane-associated protein 4-like n=1 Tax=Pempheris klunzingeri TaxID=3127111 RepID=UPI00397EDE61
MNTFLWSCAALLTLSATVESLICNNCHVSFLGICLGDTPVNCSNKQDRCYSAVAKFTSELTEIHDKGCIASGDCHNQTGSILSVNYTITRSCCSTNLCNGATSIPLPLSAALGAALVALWSQWGL